jgi:putative transcriptional regulator
VSQRLKIEPPQFRPRKSLSSGWYTRGCVAIAAISALALLVRTAMAIAQSRRADEKSFFLVASRDMADPVFQQTVIAMLPPDEPPLVAGVIINKPTDITLGKLLRQPVAPEQRNQRVYFGGPVDVTSPLLLIRTRTPPKRSSHLWSDVYSITDPDSIGDVLKDSRSANDARLFLGRAQWAQEQLRGELLEGAWSVVPIRTDLIFEHDSAKVWATLIQHEHVREIDDRNWEAGAPLPGFDLHEVDSRSDRFRLRLLTVH